MYMGEGWSDSAESADQGQQDLAVGRHAVEEVAAGNQKKRKLERHFLDRGVGL